MSRETCGETEVHFEELVPEAETRTWFGDVGPCSVDGIEVQVGVETRILAGDGKPSSGAELGAPDGGEESGPWAQGCTGELGPVAESLAQD